MHSSTELDRIRAEYSDREERFANSDIYSRTNPAHLFTLHNRKRAAIELLQAEGFSSIDNMNILEVGCGRGGVLQEYLSLGADSKRIHGTDLLFHRVTEAQDENPQIPLSCANAEDLPYASDSFDLVLQFTVFTSVLDPEVKVNIAREMLRVLRKPQGAILWYDFWINPTNHQTKGIRPSEIRALFPDCRYSFQKVTLAPPIARRVVPLSRVFAGLLEKMGLFNSHFLSLIRPS